MKEFLCQRLGDRTITNTKLGTLVLQQRHFLLYCGGISIAYRCIGLLSIPTQLTSTLGGNGAEGKISEGVGEKVVTYRTREMSKDKVASTICDLIRIARFWTFSIFRNSK
jgi:hypothetical protein